MSDVDGLISEMEAVRDAVWVKDKESGLAAITEFLLHFLAVYGRSPDVFGKVFPVLSEIKEMIAKQDYEEAYPSILAILVLLRQTREAMTE